MPDGFTGNFYINIQGATNPTLGQNGQGVCGVTLNFEHEYLGDLRITLTSPSGQQVQLVGPIGFFGPTDFTTWNVTFVPNGQPVNPDPGFSPTWNNNQPWGLNGNYSGTYYPNSGNLANFTGPVDGQWTLTVQDGQAIDVGTFYDYTIIFCDPSGINCFSCAANAGQLTQADVTACQGAASLNMNLPPTYPSGQTAPPSSEYGYQYVISAMPSGIIQEYVTTPDLTAFPPGQYSVCGMSYLLAQANEIPPPNGTLTVTQLTNQLNSSTAPFCARITTNCVNVTINPAQQNVEDFVTLCAPQCTTYYGQNYCNTGVYVRNLVQNGCPFTATLHLTVNPAPLLNFNETICEGSCATTPGFETYCSPGLHQQTFQTAAGCDSIVRLNLQVLSANAVIVPPNQISCANPTTILSGNGSTTGSGVTYQWTTVGGGTIVGATNQLSATVNGPGTYQLEVCRTLGAVQCCDQAQVTLTMNQTAPTTPTTINGPATLCPGQTATFSTPAVIGATSYVWTVPPGVVINSGQNSPTINVAWNSPSGGSVCVTASNTCGTSAPQCIPVTVGTAPAAVSPTGPTPVCNGTQEIYTVTTNPAITSYQWTVTAPNTIGAGQGSDQVVINWNGTGTAQVCASAVNGCGTSAPTCQTVTIQSTPTAPVITGPNTACAGTTGNYTVATIPGATSYSWTVTGGTITSGAGTNAVSVTWDAGATTGQICVTADNNCGASAPTCRTVTLTQPPAQPTITGTATLCAGTNGTYSVQPVAGATGYTWTVPAGATITAGQNSATITVSWAANASGGPVCVSANAPCGTGPQSCFPVTVQAQPTANAGSTASACATTLNVQAIPSVPGSTGAWSAANPAVSFGNAASAATSVTATQPGTYTLTWTETNGQCSSTSTVDVSFLTAPTTGALSYDCDATNQNYTVSFPISGATTPYTVPGGTVTNGIFTSAPIASGQPFSFTVTSANGCAAAPLTGSYDCACTTQAGSMSATALSACPGDSVQATHVGGETLDGNDVAAFVLHTNAGPSLGTVLAQNTTGAFTFQPGMSYGTTYYISYVVGNNLGGNPDPNDPCLSVTAGQPVVFHDNPVANAGSDVAVCGLTQPLSGAGAGTWTVGTTPTGGSLTFADVTDPATDVTATVAGTYTLIWTVTANGCTGTDQVTAQFNDVPQWTGLTSTCDATNENYTVTFTISGGTPAYTVNNNAITGVSFTSGAIPNGQSYNFVVSDANGCALPAITGSYNCNCATSAGSMEASASSACAGGTIQAEHLGGEFLDGNDVTAYVLHTNAGTALGTVLAQNTTGAFTFQPGMTYGTTYYVSFVVGNNNGGTPDPADPCLSVAAGQPVIFYDNPVADAGTDGSVCDLAQPLNAAAVGAGGSGQWTVGSTPSGGTLTLGDATQPGTTATASAPGTYALIWTVSANGCTGVDTVELTFNETPQWANLDHTCDAANENYVVTFDISGGLAPYTVNSTAITGSTYTSVPLPNGQPFSFTIVDANGCDLAPLTGAFSCNCSTDAGTMQATTLTACEGTTVTAAGLGDETLDGNDVAAYVLHTNAGPALGTVLDQNTTGTFGFLPGMTLGTTYYVSLVVGNNAGGIPDPVDPCLSVAPGQPVVFLAVPAPDAGADAATCGLSIDLNAQASAFAGAWALVSAPASGTSVFADTSQASSAVTVSDFGTYVFRWTETNGQCSGDDDVSITFNGLPSIANSDEPCNPTNTAFAVTFTVSGGTAPYTASGLGGAFSGNDFTSVDLPNNSTYSVTVVDANGCASPALDGAHNCNCATDAGSMLVTAAVFCADQPATATWNNDATLDGDDLVEFVLHTQSGASLGTVLATSTQPQFDLTGGLQTGVTYYISAIAGSNVNGSVDLDDICLSVAPGTPVQWRALPDAALTGATAICQGESAPLSFSGTGTGAMTLSYSDGTATQTVALAGSTGTTVNVTPAATTTYTLLGVEYSSAPACAVALNQPVTVTVNTPVSAGTAAPVAPFCAGLTTGLRLDTLLAAATPGGQWTDVSATPVPAGAFNPATTQLNTAGLAPGQYKFRYSVPAIAPCPSQSVEISFTVQANPVANAGAPVALDCNDNEAELQGPGTSTGSDIAYAWTRDGVPAGTSYPLTTTEAGVYSLLVTNTTTGCTASATTTVTADTALPQAIVRYRDVRCWNERNGVIELSDVQSAHPPVQVSFNGGPFGSAQSFTGLAAGEYTLTLLDANGCTATLNPVTINEPPQLLADLGPDITVRLGESAHLELQITAPLTGLDTIVWSPLRDTSAAGLPYQDFEPVSSERITARVVDTSGCEALARVLIVLDRTRHVYAPNIFYPAGSENSVFTIYGGKDVAEIENLQIFDRWGEQIFEVPALLPNDESRGWRGDYRGKPAAPGVYVYYAVIRFIDGERSIYTGDVTVYR